MALYDEGLLEKPRIVVANKMDEAASEENLKAFKRKIRKTAVLPMSAAFDEGVEKFKKVIRETVEQVEAEAAREAKATSKRDDVPSL